MRFTKLFLLLIIFANSSLAADFSIDYFTRASGTKLGAITLDGPIQKGDYAEFLETYEWVLKKSDAVAIISLNSDGGLVGEALSIGQHIREKRIRTFVHKDNKCYSSCALIFLSGLYRDNDGKVGVHRSYFNRGTDLSFDELEETLGKSHDKIIDYLRSMRVPETIIEDFITTSSAKIKLLSDIPNDRLYDEYMISKCGKHPVGERPKKPDYLTQESFLKWRMLADAYSERILSKEYGPKIRKYNDCFFPTLDQLSQSVQK